MKTFLAFIALLIGLSTVAQNQFAEKKSGFSVTSGTETTELFTLDNETFPVFKTEKGSKYIIAISSKGEYPVWIHNLTGDTYNDLPVYKSKNGKYCIYKMNKNGYPYASWLNLLE